MTASLEAGGLDTGQRTFVMWLGVTLYLTEDAVYATLGELARFPGGAVVVFDYANPPRAIEEAHARALHHAMAENVAASGEPFRCYLDTQSCMSAPAPSATSTSRISTARPWSRCICRRPRRGFVPGPAAMWRGWRRRRGARPSTLSAGGDG